MGIGQSCGMLASPPPWGFLLGPRFMAPSAGTGPRNRAAPIHLSRPDRVHFHGCREDAASLFRAFDVWVLSSRSEGTPMVLFEAMAAGVPIVATRVGGVDDAVSEAEACLVPPEDHAALAGCLADIHSGRQSTEQRLTAATARLREQHGTAQGI